MNFNKLIKSKMKMYNEGNETRSITSMPVSTSTSRPPVSTTGQTTQTTTTNPQQTQTQQQPVQNNTQQPTQKVSKAQEFLQYIATPEGLKDLKSLPPDVIKGLIQKFQ